MTSPSPSPPPPRSVPAPSAAPAHARGDRPGRRPAGRPWGTALLRLLRDYPLTIVVTMLLVICGIGTGAVTAPVAPWVYDRFGIALADCFHGDALPRQLESLPFSAGGAIFWKVLALTIPAIALGERLLGRWRTLACLLGLHGLAFATEAAVLRGWSDVPVIAATLHVRDFGMSEGTYGVAALAGWRLPGRLRFLVWACIALALAKNVLLHLAGHDLRGLASDGGHVVGIAWSFLLGWWWWRHPPTPPPLPTSRAAPGARSGPGAGGRV